jgi:hypothetical protein
MDVIMRALEGCDATDHLRRARHGDRRPLCRTRARFYEGRVIADGTPAVVLGNAEVQRYVTGVAP